MDDYNIQNENFWRQLEILSLTYISDKINKEIPHASKLTHERNDGGFDGKIVINITEDSQIKHTILFESKFRTTIKTLPLSDCSKALIIAFNQAVQTLFIVTNVLFSPQAKHEINTFRKKVNLNIIDVDGPELKVYISKHRDTLESKCSEEFLQCIASFPNKDIDIKVEKISNNKSVLDNSKKADFIYRTLFYKKQLKMCISMLKEKSSFYIIQGYGGVGKTIFLNEWLNRAIQEGYSPALFDLQQCSTPKILFTKILETLWGVDLTSYLQDYSSEKAIPAFRELIEYTSDGKIDADLSLALIQALNLDINNREVSKNSYFYLLSHYIYLLLKPYSNNKIIFAFMNLNKAELETINFLYTLLCQINGLVSLIIEIRPYFTLENVIPELIQIDYYHKILSISDRPNFIEIEEWKPSEALEYLSHILGNMPERQFQYIINTVGTNSLYLHSVTVYIRQYLKTAGLNPEIISDRILHEILQRFQKDRNGLILNNINNYCKDKDIEICFAITGLLDGTLPNILIEKIWGPDQAECIYKKLDNIEYYKFKGNKYFIKQNFIYDNILDALSPRVKYLASKRIYDYIKTKKLLHFPEVKTFELLYYMQDYTELMLFWKHLALSLNAEHQYYSLIKYGNLALECYDHIEIFEQDVSWQIDIITTILDAYIQVRVLQTENFLSLLNKFKTICNLNKYNSNGQLLRARYCFYEWNRLFYSANIDQSFQVISEAKEIIQKKDTEDKLSANILWAYALSHKRKTSIQQAILDLEQSLKKYPNNALLKISLVLHQAHINLRNNPSNTEELCKKLLQDIEGMECPYHEYLQIHVDILIAEFYAKKYEQCSSDCEKVLQMAHSLGAAYQIGRLLNIKASCQLIFHSYYEAEKNYERSIIEFSESGNSLLGWRALFNKAQLYLCEGKKSKALKIFNKLYNGIIPNLTERMTYISLDNTEFVAFLYTVRILIENKQYKENATVKLFLPNKTYTDIVNMSSEEFYEAMNKLSYIHNDCLIILG